MNGPVVGIAKCSRRASRPLLVAISFVIIFIMGVGRSGAEPQFGSNLLSNPGAKAGNISGWQSADSEYTVWTSVEGYTPHQGSYFFYAGPVETNKLWQEVKLSDKGFTDTIIDSGSCTLMAGGYQLSYDQGSIWIDKEDDKGQIKVYFLDAAKDILATWSGPVKDNNVSWEKVEYDAPIQSGTRYILFEFTATRITGRIMMPIWIRHF